MEDMNTRRSADFKVFLLHEDNKMQLFDLMLRVWSSGAAASWLQNRKMMLVVKGGVFTLTSPDGQSVQQTEVQKNQEETDSRIILYINHAHQQGYETVVVRSPDSDVFFILLYYAYTFQVTILFDTSSGNKRRLLNISEITGELGE